MVKRFLLASLVIVALTVGLSNDASAQSTYKTGLGMRIDFGDGTTLAGFSVKHFFQPHHAGEAQLLFGGNSTYLGFEYQYHDAIPNAAGLQWYAGLGPGFQFYNGGSNIYLRPSVGLDYKINDVPLNVGFDWRPAALLNHGGDFNAARFGIAFRFTLN
ncbi:MAG: hypothetical protein J0I41_09740 [Filimonas sp.]|nr:hypothetical protein [Filimonas sp.]